jgi:hypothetical protein
MALHVVPPPGAECKDPELAASFRLGNRHVPAHPDFDDRSPPREATLGPFTLTLLSPADVEEDFAVVIESADVLDKIFDSDWPNGLTLERNLADLQRHEREFFEREAFAWLVRDSADGSYLGCVYVRPQLDAPRTAKIWSWMRRRPDRIELLSEFNGAFREWLTPHLPDGYATIWKSNDQPGPDT